MKKWILALFALIVLTGPLHAGGIGPMLGHWDSGDAGDDQGAGVRVTVDLGPKWNMELRTTWLDSFFQIGDGILFRIEALPIDVGLSYGFDTAGKIEPYVGVGLTYLDINPNVIDTEIRRRIEVHMPEEIGIHFMAGLDYPIMNDKLSLFAEAIYRSIKTEANSTDIRDFDSDMTGIGANFGLVLNF
jgi:outer membrane protein W